MNKIRNLLIGSLLVVLVLPTSLAFAAGSEDFRGVSYAHCAETGSFRLKVKASAVMICTTRLPTYRARKLIM